MNPFLALAFGTTMGVIVQTVAARLRYNGQWADTPLGKRIAMSAVGGIAAFAFGLIVLDHPRAVPTTPYVYRLWLVQTLAAWLGSVALDAAGKILLAILDALREGKGRNS